MNSHPFKIKSIGSGSLSIMAKPVSGDFIDDEFKGLSINGVTLLVSLLERSEAYQLGLAQEFELCEKWNMDFMNYPIEDRNIPSQLSSYDRFIRVVYGKISGGAHAAVHCRSGIGRAGLVSACILMHENCLPIDAFAAVSDARGVSVPDTEEQYHFCTETYVNYVGI